MRLKAYIPFAICALLFSCASGNKNTVKQKRDGLGFSPTHAIYLTNFKNEEKLLRKAKDLSALRENAYERGVIEIRLLTFPKLKQSLKNSRPVIVKLEEGYSLINGLDVDEQVFLYRQDNKNKRISFEEFTKEWRKAGRYAANFIEPEEIEKGDELEEIFRQALLIEEANLPKARRIYDSLIKIAPSASEPYLALANTYLFEEPEKSAAILKEAARHNPNSFPVWHNLAVAQAKAGKRYASLRTGWKARTMFKAGEVPDRLVGNLRSLGTN